jgi:hypothetical protein
MASCLKGMAEIVWHRRETRRQTEKTKFSLKLERDERGKQLPVIAMEKSAEAIVVPYGG